MGAAEVASARSCPLSAVVPDIAEDRSQGLFSMYVPLWGNKDVGATFMLLFSADVSRGIFQL